MSILGDKLRVALNQIQVDDEGVPTEITTVTTQEKQMQKLSASEAAFDYVMQTPGCTATQAGRVLARDGYNESTISALIYQMVKQGMIRKDEKTKRVYAAQSAYTPIKTNQRTTKRKYTRKEKAGLAALPRAMPTVEKPTPYPTMLTADYIMKNISLAEARELFDQLNGFFG